MQLDTFVMAIMMLFVFLGYAVYVFYMFLVPFFHEEEKDSLERWNGDVMNFYNHNDPSLD